MLLPMYSTRIIMREKKVFGVDFFFLSLSCLIEGYREKRVVNLKFTLLISTTYSVLFYKLVYIFKLYFYPYLVVCGDRETVLY